MRLLSRYILDVYRLGDIETGIAFNDLVICSIRDDNAHIYGAMICKKYGYKMDKKIYLGCITSHNGIMRCKSKYQMDEINLVAPNKALSTAINPYGKMAIVTTTFGSYFIFTKVVKLVAYERRLAAKLVPKPVKLTNRMRLNIKYANKKIKELFKHSPAGLKKFLKSSYYEKCIERIKNEKDNTVIKTQCALYATEFDYA
jgi:hypothetical protein